MKKKKEIKVEMHQHIDKNKVAFGKLHPLDSKHKKASTQEAHDNTLVYILKKDFIRKVN